MKKIRALTLGLSALLSLSACAWSEDFGGQSVPEKSFYYPVDIVASPRGMQGSRYVYVLNSNFDWFYNSGWISVIDIDVLARAIASKDPSKARNSITQQLNILGLGGQLALNSEGDLLMVGHRGRSTLTVIQAEDDGSEGMRLSCSNKSDEHRSGDEQRTDCTRRYMVHIEDVDDTQVAQALDFPTQERWLIDPYGVALFDDGSDSMAAISFLTSPYVGFLKFDASKDPVLTPTKGMTFGVGAVGLLKSATFSMGAETRPFLFASSQYNAPKIGITKLKGTIWGIDVNRVLEAKEDAFSTFSVDDALGATGVRDFTLVSSNLTTLEETYALSVNSGPGSIGLYRVYAETELDRSVSTRTWKTEPVLELVDALALKGNPYGLTQIGNSTEDSSLFAVGVFEENGLVFLRQVGERLVQVGKLGGLWPEDIGKPQDQEDSLLGRGPVALTYVEREVDSSTVKYLLVANFFDHSVTVIDVSSSDPTAFKVVERIKNDAV